VVKNDISLYEETSCLGLSFDLSMSLIIDIFQIFGKNFSFRQRLKSFSINDELISKIIFTN
jgi:hypothetical protein